MDTRYYNWEKNIGKSTWNDRWIAEIVLPERYGGFYIEAGACGGIAGSCTYFFEKKREWTGLLFEPIDDWYQALVKNRPNSYCINKCLSSKKGEVNFLHFIGSKGRSTTYEFRGKHHDKFMEEIESEIITRPSITLEQSLKECGAPLHIDYMALDLNGSEYDVLSVFPFSKYTFSAISVEADKCNALLQDAGYVKVFNPFTTVNFENYFVARELAEETEYRYRAITK